MTDTARPTVPADATPLLDLVLYSRPGCHLCDEAREIALAVLDRLAAGGRAAPALVERDITTDPIWEREFLTTIPVLELGDRRLELATSPTRIRAFIEATP